ncbi:MAG TPA: ferredoxin [Candidatus Nanoarchaeia archaeon]|nr:ferredoxin [Candidatus Nanoarchaeia archaeon]
MVIKVDKKTCIGCGHCTAICSEVFVMDKDGKAKTQAQKDLPCVDKAIAECPVKAISK